MVQVMLGGLGNAIGESLFGEIRNKNFQEKSMKKILPCSPLSRALLSGSPKLSTGRPAPQPAHFRSTLFGL